jgi:hypothetical protein
MNNELEKMWKERAFASLKAGLISENLRGETEENHEAFLIGREDDATNFSKTSEFLPKYTASHSRR